MLAIKTKDDRLEFSPCGTVEGIAEWKLRDKPDHVRLFLMWYTLGKGDEDAAIVDEIELNVSGSSGEQPFSFQLPNEPYSFDGQLISLQWALEIVSDDPDEVYRLDIVVSPWVEKVTLPADDSNEKIEFSSDDD